MLPLPLVEWIVWARLDDEKSHELILLKGHLLVELFLNARLVTSLAQENKVVEDLSFFRKLMYLDREVVGAGDTQKAAVVLARELNSLRNRLAHEILFEHGDREFGDWSDRVLRELPFTKMQRYTSRTRLTQAVAALAKAIYSEDSDA